MQERGLTPFKLGQMKKYDVNRAGAVEALWSPLYDYQIYPLGGVNELIFFQVPQGQAGKTLDDTNLEIAGSLPAPKEFAVTSIQVAFYPAAVPGRTAAAEIASNWNDVYNLSQSGHLRLFIGSKEYVVDAPIGKFPPRWWIRGSDAVATTDAAVSNIIDYATFGGPIYEVVPYRLIPTQNFSVTLRFANGLVPITADSRIGVILGGFMYRLSQ
ncbi:MAG: hypothetical protein GY807_23540 [Gammaproteobacteria bacterium]|nr:hypothetical protein [Gammaproteobacteria bacterium]